MPRPSYLVECCWPDATEVRVVAAVDRAPIVAAGFPPPGGHAALTGVFCVFDGADTDVRTIRARHGLPVDRRAALVRIRHRKEST